jgi:hypothetical protein
MRELNRTKLKSPQIIFTIASDKNYEAKVNYKSGIIMNDILSDESRDNEWAQEYYLIYNSHEMLYRNDA